MSLSFDSACRCNTFHSSYVLSSQASTRESTRQTRVFALSERAHSCVPSRHSCRDLWNQIFCASALKLSDIGLSVCCAETRLGVGRMTRLDPARRSVPIAFRITIVKKNDSRRCGADAPVRAGPRGPALRPGRRGRRQRTRGSAPLCVQGVFEGACATRRLAYSSKEASNAIIRPAKTIPAQRIREIAAASLACAVIPASRFSGCW